LPALASIPHYENPDTEFIRRQAAIVRPSLTAVLNNQFQLN